MTALIISTEEIEDIMKIVKSLQESGLLIKRVSETTETEAKEQKGKLFRTLLGTLGVSVLGNILPAKLKIPGPGVTRAGEGAFRAGQDF